jgi:predicted acylesterase/phospholipase RssA/CRP-like cAMP-binding protein
MTDPASSLEPGARDNDIIDLLKGHTYFRGISDAALDEVARLGLLTDYAAGAVVHQLDDPLSSICFVLRGRLRAVRVDSRGDEQLFQMFERGEQYGMMIGGLGDPLPLRILAPEPSTILSLDHEQAMDLMLLYPELRRRWSQRYAQSLRRRFVEPVAGEPPQVLAMVHHSPGTRPVAQKIIGRLQELGEAACVLSDTDSWRSVADVRFRSLLDGSKPMEVATIRRQIAEWNHANRVAVDTTAQNLDWAVLLRAADCVLLFIRPGEIRAAIERLGALQVAAQGWRDKIAIVWVLDNGSTTTAEIPDLHTFASRQFKIHESPLGYPWGKAVHSASMERLIHHLRGVRIGIALGGGAARGMAHLGVLKVLDEQGIVPDVIVGTSVGAMTGILYSSGLDCDYIADRFAADLKLPWIFRQLPNGGYWYLLYQYRRGGFEDKLRQYLHHWELEQLTVPCMAVTLDLVSGQAMLRERGDAVQAILESINLPILSAPICRNGQALVDGGLVNNIPADVLTSQGCNFLIAVSVTAKIKSEFGANRPDTPTPEMRVPSNLRTLLRTLEVQNFNLNRVGAKPAEVVIEPEVTNFDLSEFMRAKELAAAGEKAALVKVTQIKQMLARLDARLFPFAS